MRRLGTIVALAVSSLIVTPAPADAYFWAWLDDWSGPRFMGTELEYRLWCRSEQPSQNRPLLLSLRRRIRWELARYEAEAPTAASEKHLKLAITYARIADGYLEGALYPREGALEDEADQEAMRAVQWRAFALAQFKWALDRKQGRTLDEVDAPEEPPLPAADEQPADGEWTFAHRSKLQTSRFVGAGVPISLAVSACDYQPLQRERQFLNLKVGWAFDAKDSTERFEHRMVTVGAAYHIVAAPFLTIGTGGGVAVFSSNLREPFYKFYLQPTIVDVRPFAIGPNARTRNPWWHVVYLRYNTMVVPTGFDPGSFGGQTQRYSAELVHNLGVHADLTPVVRKLQGRW
jgi:hypothetical protein